MDSRLEKIKADVIQKIRFEQSQNTGQANNDLDMVLGGLDESFWLRNANSAYDKIRFELMPAARKARIASFIASKKGGAR